MTTEYFFCTEPDCDEPLWHPHSRHVGVCAECQLIRRNKLLTKVIAEQKERLRQHGLIT